MNKPQQNFQHVLLVTILAIALAGCAAPPDPVIPPSAYAPGHQAAALEQAIHAIETSTPAGWNQFAQLSREMDGEKGELFADACAYLIRRDPTIFLRRHLAGDPQAIFCAREAYQWSGQNYQRVLDAVYRFRLQSAQSPAERHQIQHFTTLTTSK